METGDLWYEVCGMGSGRPEAEGDLSREERQHWGYPSIVRKAVTKRRVMWHVVPYSTLLYQAMT